MGDYLPYTRCRTEGNRDSDTTRCGTSSTGQTTGLDIYRQSARRPGNQPVRKVDSSSRVRSPDNTAGYTNMRYYPMDTGSSQRQRE